MIAALIGFAVCMAAGSALTLLAIAVALYRAATAPPESVGYRVGKPIPRRTTWPDLEA